MNRDTFLICVALLTLLLYPGAASAATGQHLYFNHLNANSGLSQNTVSCVMQDQAGFIWVGTNLGVDRFDGVRFRHFRHLPGSTVTSLYQSPDGLIWIGTNAGAAIYDPATESTQFFSEIIGQDQGAPTTQINAITTHPSGHIVIGVDVDGIYDYDPESKRLQLVIDSRQKGLGAIYRMAIDPEGNLWIGTYGHGLYVSDATYSSLRQIHGDSIHPLFDKAVISGLVTNAGAMLVSTDNCGLYSIDRATRQATPVFVADQDGQVPYIRDFLCYSPEEVWIATEQGLYIYNFLRRTTQHFRHNYFDPYSLSDNALYSLLKDRDGGVWVSSYFGGLDYMNPQSMFFEKYYKGNSLYANSGQRVRELCEDAKGNIWIGSEDGGLSCFNPQTKECKHIAASDDFTNVHGLCIDGEDLWIGTFSKGLKIYNLPTGKIRSITLADCKGMVSDYVFSICRTRAGDLYFGTISGLQTYNRSTGYFETVPALRDIFSYVVKEDTHGSLWVGTYSSGLYCRKAGLNTWKHYTVANGLGSDRIIGIYEDMEGTLWVMTSEGLTSIDVQADAFTDEFAKRHNITDIVYQLIEDQSGIYWATTNRGLYRIEPKAERQLLFTVEDGLTNNQFNYASSLMSRSGKIYFGTIDGMIAFDPALERYDEEQPMPIISQASLLDKPLLPDDEDSPITESISTAKKLTLRSDQNSLIFDIALLKYGALANAPIKYRMAGLDRDWRYTTLSEAKLAYPNMPYGKYQLQVRAIDEKTQTEGPELTLDIVIKTPFYLTPWAFISYGALLCLLMAATFYYYRRRSQIKNEQALERSRQEQEREAYDSKIKFFTNVAHEIRTPLTLIKAPLDDVFRSDTVKKDHDVQENLDVINLNVDRLLLLVNQLLDFRKMENGKFQIHKRQTNINDLIQAVLNRFQPTIQSGGFKLTLNLPEQPVIAMVDPEAFTKILSNLFTNALKYGESIITVTLCTNGPNFQVIVTNDGEIVDPTKREQIFEMFNRAGSESVPGTGIGLSYARSLARLHDGYLVMGEELTENTFILTMPIDSATDLDVNEVEDLEYLIKRNKDMNTILVVEDNEEMLAMLVKRLSPHNYRVVTATNGLEALKVLDQEYVDLIVSDVMMPEMDGFQFLEKLRSNVKYSHIPVILLTAKTGMRDKLEGLQLGADAYIEKPFAIEYLLAQISALLRNRERLRQKIETADTPRDAGLSEVDTKFLEQLNAIIQENYSNPDFSMDDVFDSLGMSRTSFYRKIKGLLNQTPNDYIRIYRLKKGAELFEKGYANVAEVCYMVGFSSPSYFTKCFQKQFGINPKDYATQQRRVPIS